MTLEEFKNLLERTTLPCSFDHFKTPQPLPYLIYLVTDNNEFAADNSMEITITISEDPAEASEEMKKYL